MLDLPNGTVTLFFTDVEGSTRLLQRLGERYGSVLEDQRRIVRAAVVDAGGSEIDSRGDEVFAAFPRARAAAAAAVAIQRALAAHEWPDGEQVKVRMGLHTGEPALRDDGYLGIDVHRAARISAAAYGGQVLVSQVTHDLLVGGDVRFRNIGEHQLKDLPVPERLFQLVIDGLPSDFPPPKVAAAAPAAGRERELASAIVAAPRRLLARIHPNPRGLADLGWDVRAMLAGTPEEERDSLSRLARDLFDASRAAAEADHALAVVDRKALARHLADNRSNAIVSKAAAREAESTARQLDALDALAARRAETEALAAAVRSQLNTQQISAADVDAFRERSQAATEGLNAALDVARSELNAVSAKLRRTRHAGVFRIGEHFVVPFFDDLGVERRRDFEAVGDAVAFRRGVRIGERGSPGDKETARLRGEYLGTFARNPGQEMGILPPRSGRDR